MPTADSVAAVGGAVVAAVAVVPLTFLSLPWTVILIASVVAGIVALVAAANRQAAKHGQALLSLRAIIVEFTTGAVAGVVMWALTDYFSPDPRLQLAAMILAGWQARNALDEYLPRFWHRITGS